MVILLVHIRLVLQDLSSCLGQPVLHIQPLGLCTNWCHLPQVSAVAVCIASIHIPTCGSIDRVPTAGCYKICWLLEARSRRLWRSSQRNGHQTHHLLVPHVRGSKSSALAVYDELAENVYANFVFIRCICMTPGGTDEGLLAGLFNNIKAPCVLRDFRHFRDPICIFRHSRILIAQDGDFKR